MFRPRYEDPIDSAKDLVDRNIIIYEEDYFFDSLKFDLLSMDRPEWRHLGKTMVSVSWYEYYNFTKHNVQGNRTKESGGTHGFLGPYLFPEHLEVAPERDWWRSFEMMSGFNNYAGYLTAKRWILNEVEIDII